MCFKQIGYTFLAQAERILTDSPKPIVMPKWFFYPAMNISRLKFAISRGVTCEFAWKNFDEIYIILDHTVENCLEMTIDALNEKFI